MTIPESNAQREAALKELGDLKKQLFDLFTFITDNSKGYTSNAFDHPGIIADVMWVVGATAMWVAIEDSSNRGKIGDNFLKKFSDTDTLLRRFIESPPAPWKSPIQEVIDEAKETVKQ